MTFKEQNIQRTQVIKKGVKNVVGNIDKIAKTGKNILSKICVVASLATDKKFDWLEGE